MLVSCRASTPAIGGDWLLPSFAAPIIGGVALAGGTVAVLGTVLAAMVVRLVDAREPQFKLDAQVVNFVVGAVVLGTVALGRLREVKPRGEPVAQVQTCRSGTRGGVPMTVALEVRSLTKTFPGVRALDEVNLRSKPERCTRSSARTARASRRSSRS